MFTLTKYLFFVLLLMGAGKLSEIEFEEMKKAEMELPKDKDNDGQHDYNCECGYCLEWNNDSINEWYNQFQKTK